MFWQAQHHVYCNIMARAIEITSKYNISGRTLKGQWFIYRSADKSLARPGRKQATSMSKSSWMMDPTRSREMPSCSAIDLDEIRGSSKIRSWIWSVISGVIGLRTYQHPGIYIYIYIYISPGLKFETLYSVHRLYICGLYYAHNKQILFLIQQLWLALIMEERCCSL